jgi:HSP20 family molecular chaperone IbpA
MAVLLPRRIVDFADWLDAEFRTGEGHAIRMEDHLSNDEYEVRAELPGVDPAKDVEVTVDGDVLNIHAERREHQKAGGRSEFRYGRLERSVRLPRNADAEHITAGYVDGVLSVKVPLTALGPSGRKIEISSGGGQASQKAVAGDSAGSEQ